MLNVPCKMSDMCMLAIESVPKLINIMKEARSSNVVQYMFLGHKMSKRCLSLLLGIGRGRLKSATAADVDSRFAVFASLVQCWGVRH